MKLTQAQIDVLKAKLGLTDFQAAELKANLASFAAKADETADNWLAKLGKSKWTWAIIIAIIAAAWALGFIQG